MKVLAFSEGPNHVCYRYRIEAFAWALADRGWTLESQPLAPNTFERSPQLRAALDAHTGKNHNLGGRPSVNFIFVP